MQPFDIILIVVLIAAAWALVELALTIRKSRSTLETLTETVNETIAEVKPVVQKLDGVVDELEGSSKEIQPLLSKVSTAVDATSLTLIHVDSILQDVSTVTGAGAQVTGAITSAANSAADAASSVARKLTGKAPKQDAPQLKDGADTRSATSTQGAEAPNTNSSKAPAPEKDRYFTYPSAADKSGEPESSASSESDTH